MDRKEIFGKRLKLARQKEKLSMEELCHKAGDIVTKQTISKYESGKAIAGTRILESLARVLGVSIAYFFRDFSFNMGETKISFRKKASVKAKDENSLKSMIQDKVEIVFELEKILSIDRPTCSTIKVPSNISKDIDMIKLAREVRRNWRIGNAAIENTNDILTNNGIKVFDVNGPIGFDGVSGIVNDKNWVIVLNKNVNHIERKRFTAFHEYAHLLANNSFDCNLSAKEKESLCNAFASELLLPSEILYNQFGTKSKIAFQELVTLQCIYGISIDAIMYSLKKSSIISDKRHRSYCMRKNIDKSFKERTELSRYIEKDSKTDTDPLKTLVYKALAQEYISTNRAAEFLSCSISEVETNSIAF